ncbi:MAG: hypothetical protein Q4A03_02580 [Rothia sp. (in: high G+C Gram-positive bacteria)]|uniref:hypothetical protein n=1 Tax=Rothia sp. (in: high G+C Gram-positive bacteria) TaxID=1885016 RepID=UPI00270F9754|nr:hypothetical protein [Rothia sp. (in: high G+C Gram-positive bacteria)]
MLPGKYEPGPVIEAKLRIYVNDTERPHVSASWGIDTTGGLPDALVNAGTGIRSRTGEVIFSPQKSVTNGHVSPLATEGGWPPKDGDRIVIKCEVGGVEFTRFTGRIGKVSAPFYGGEIKADIKDTLGDLLDTTVTIPPRIDTGKTYIRSEWVINAALEQAHLGAILSPGETSTIHQGMQAGNEPLAGTVEEVGTEYSDPYGLSIWSGFLTLADPAITHNGSGVGGFARASSTLDSGFRIAFANGEAAYLGFTQATKMLYLRVSGQGVVWEAPYEGDSPLPELIMWINHQGIWVWRSPSKQIYAYATTKFTSQNVASTSGDYLAGVDVRYSPLTEFRSVVTNSPKYPVAYRKSWIERARTVATRTFENRQARTIVDEWGAATLASMWMDELGKPCAWARDRLVSMDPSRKIKVSEKVFSGQWELGRDSRRGDVTVVGEYATVQRSRPGLVEVTVYQPTTAKTFEESQKVEEFYSVPAEEEWGQVDITPLQANRGNHFKLNNGTWIGGTFFKDDADTTDEEVSFNGDPASLKLEKLGLRTLKGIIGFQFGSVTSATGYLQTRNIPRYHPVWRSQPTPIIRAVWRSQWAGYTVHGKTRVDGQGLKSYKHECGPWLTPSDAQRLADAISAEVTQERYTFTGVSLLWDPTRQVGDVETWEMEDLEENPLWTARCLVTGYNEKWQGNVPEQSVDVQIISLTDPKAGKTYADRSKAYRTYQDTVDTGATYDEVYRALPQKVSA